MRKISLFVVFTILLMCFTLFACNSDSKPNGNIDNQEIPEKSYDLPDSYDFDGENEGYQYGITEEIEYYSKVAGGIKHATVTLPYGYNNERKYPVIYLLHGLTLNEHAWLDYCNAKYIIQNLHYFEDAPEMIVVGVNCIVNATEKEPFVTSPELTKVYDKTGQDIVECLMPYINDNYSTLTGRNNTALAGFSMGGRETLYAGFTYQKYFGYLGAFSSANFNDDVTKVEESNPIMTEFTIDESVGGFKLILLTTGQLDFMTPGVTQRFDKMMTESGIEHLFYLEKGGHDFTVWKSGLYNFVKRIF